METINNLVKAFIGESQARNRYTIYSNIARKEGHEQIADIFLETADNERVHAKWLFRMIKDINKGRLKDIHVDALAPLVLSDTVENLKDAIVGEHYENVTMYPGFADVAAKERFPDVAKRLKAIAIAERHHEERYISLLKELEGGSLLKKKNVDEWICKKCGYVHKGKEPPEKCPACNHESNYFELRCERY